MIAFLSFALATVLVLAGAGAATSALTLTGRLDRTLALAILAICQIVASMLIAGALLSELTRAAVLVTNAVLTACLIALATWRRGGLPLPTLPPVAELRGVIWDLSALVRAHPWCST